MSSEVFYSPLEFCMVSKTSRIGEVGWMMAIYQLQSYQEGIPRETGRGQRAEPRRKENTEMLKRSRRGGEEKEEEGR